MSRLRLNGMDKNLFRFCPVDISLPDSSTIHQLKVDVEIRDGVPFAIVEWYYGECDGIVEINLTDKSTK